MAGRKPANNQRLRDALDSGLSRNELAALTERLGLDVSDRRKKARHIDALLSSFGCTAEVLQALRVAELRALCTALELAKSGNKSQLIARIEACVQPQKEKRAR